MIKSTTILLLSLLLVNSSAPSVQTTQQSSGQPRGLSVEQIVQMVKAGLSEDLIIARLRRDGKSFDLSPEDMVNLKQQRVSENIMQVMMDPKAEIRTTASPAPSAAPATLTGPGGAVMVVQTAGVPSGATPAPGTATGDPNDPLNPHDSGIYIVLKTREGKDEMVVLERAAYQGAKTAGTFTAAMTYGIKKAKMKAVIPGPRATIRSGDSRPTFYFYFEEKAAGLGKSSFGMGSLSSPNQFALVKLEAKQSNRETIIGEVGAFGASSGTHQKSMIPFRSERIRPGLYRVVPTSAMEDGEYCFLASAPMAVAGGAAGAGAVAPVDIFDFAISTR